jgi:hypothetical protein
VELLLDDDSLSYETLEPALWLRSIICEDVVVRWLSMNGKLSLDSMLDNQPVMGGARYAAPRSFPMS